MAGPSTPPSDGGFAIVRRGYDQGQVDAHLQRVDADVQILATDRLAAVDQAAHLARELDEARARVDRLRIQVRTLVSPPQSVQGMSERMRSMLRLAEDEVAEMLATAEAEVTRRQHEADAAAAQTWARARAEADTSRAGARVEAERAVQENARVRAEFDAEHGTALARLAAERAEIDEQVRVVVGRAEQERADAWAESERRRATIESDFALAMDQRRTEALSALAAERLDLRRDIEERREAAAAAVRADIEQAEVEARRIVREAERRVGDLAAVRRRVAEQLGAAHEVLARTIADLGPLPVEHAPSEVHSSADKGDARPPATNGRDPGRSDHLSGAGPRPPEAVPGPPEAVTVPYDAAAARTEDPTRQRVAPGH